MSGRIEAVLFDFGGVFTESPFGAAAGLGEDEAEGRGLVEVIFGPYGEDTDHPWHRLERGELSLADAREAIIALGRERGLDADPFRLFGAMRGGSGIRDDFVLRARRLREAGIRTAVVTNNVREFRDAWRGLVPVVELFDVVVDSSEVGMRKPAAGIFRRALELLGGVAPERALFLDDFPGNVEAARRLGMRAVLVELDPAEALAALDALLDGS